MLARRMLSIDTIRVACMVASLGCMHTLVPEWCKHSGTIPHDLVVLALVLVIFTIFAAVRRHVQLVRFGRFVRSERARTGRAFGFTYVMRHLNHAKTNRTSNGARTKKCWLFDVGSTQT